MPALPAGTPQTTVTITDMPNPTQQYIITLDGVVAVTADTPVSYRFLPGFTLKIHYQSLVL